MARQATAGAATSARSAAPARTPRAAATAPARAPRKTSHPAPAPARTRPRTAPARRKSGPAQHTAAPSRTAPKRTAPKRAPSRATPKRTAPGRTTPRPQPVPGALRRALLARGKVLLDRLLRGRLWVVCVGALLAGIVFLNVGLLQLNDQIARSDRKAAALGRENSDLRLRLAKLDSTERIQQLAEARGFVMPAPGAVRYVRSRPGDARNAARRTIAPEPHTLVAAPPPATAIQPAVPPGAATPPGTTTPPSATVVPGATTAQQTVPQQPAVTPPATAQVP
jgi:cell division protein FtsL